MAALFLLSPFLLAAVAVLGGLLVAAARRARLRGALLASAAHDLRTPLSTIIGAATTLESLADRVTPEDRLDLARTIAAEARRLDRHIQNLLDASRLEHGRVAAGAEWVDLRDLVVAARKRLRDPLTGCDVTVSIPEDATFARADPALLEQVLVNILDNAARHGRPGGHIVIAAEAQAGRLFLSVLDDGPGVAPEARARLFRPFERAGAGPGTGLGLAIARGFTEAMGGRIAASAPAGGGTRIEITLPRPRSPVLEGADGDSPPRTSHG